MTEKAWAAVDGYIGENLLGDVDAIFEQVIRANAAGGLPSIDVSPAQGKFLQLMVRISGARRVLEIGTLGGYSTIWMASVLPADGRLVTLEASPKHAEVASDNLARAGLLEVAEVRVGPAAETLPGLAGEAPFDLVFIDADKANNALYLDWAVKLSRPGTVVILDNVVREGGVLDASDSSAAIRGTRAAFEYVREHRQLDSTALQTVGAKGWDGFILSVVR